jgi:hypothetical protein
MNEVGGAAHRKSVAHNLRIYSENLSKCFAGSMGAGAGMQNKRGAGVVAWNKRGTGVGTQNKRGVSAGMQNGHRCRHME